MLQMWSPWEINHSDIVLHPGKGSYLFVHFISTTLYNLKNRIITKTLHTFLTFLTIPHQTRLLFHYMLTTLLMFFRKL